MIFSIPMNISIKDVQIVNVFGWIRYKNNSPLSGFIFRCSKLFRNTAVGARLGKSLMYKSTTIYAPNRLLFFRFYLHDKYLPIQYIKAHNGLKLFFYI